MKIKKIIILLIYLIIVVVSLLFIINNRYEKEDYIYENKNYDEDLSGGDAYSYEIKKVEDASIFYSISYCIEKYCDNLYINYNTYDQEMIEKRRDNLYNVLDKTYIEENNITKQNIFEHVKIRDEQVEFTATQMNELIGEKNSVYAVRGFLENSENKYIEEICFKVILNTDNTTYSIVPIENSKNKQLSEINLTLDNLDEIEANEDNRFVITNVSYSSLLTRYMVYYKNMALNYPDRAYELLDENYRKNRFANLEEFRKYIDIHKEEINNIKLDKYQINNYEDYVQYITLDTNSNYYMFQENGIMQYSLMLDTYTIDLPEFIEKYEKSDGENKVALNVEKIKNALNEYDYKYMYNKLDDTFKQNNYSTYNEFVQYIKGHLFDENEFEHKSIKQQGNVYVATILITDKNQMSSEAVEMNIIMKLNNESTDFSISFNIEG